MNPYRLAICNLATVGAVVALLALYHLATVAGVMALLALYHLATEAGVMALLALYHLATVAAVVALFIEVKVKSSVARSLTAENLLPQNVGSIINYLQ